MEKEEIRIRCLECATKIVILKIKVGNMDVPIDETLNKGSMQDRVRWTIMAANDMERYVEKGIMLEVETNGKQRTKEEKDGTRL